MRVNRVRMTNGWNEEGEKERKGRKEGRKKGRKEEKNRTKIKGSG